MSAADRDAARVSIRILEKEYMVACPHEERSALLDAAEFLNGKMREIRDTGKVVGLDRVAVMAALNLAHELLKLQDKDRRSETEQGNRVRALRERIDGALQRGQQLDL
ncbi:MAG: cell division protein ZapA [Steroidobacteraceae bacterium]